MNLNSLANLAPAFPKGVSPNPGGKPKASRNRLQGAFLRDLAADFDEHGKKAIRECRENDPSAYMRAIVALMPKELEVHRQFDDLTDEQLESIFAACGAILAAQDGGRGDSLTQGAEPAQELQALPETG